MDRFEKTFACLPGLCVQGYHSRIRYDNSVTCALYARKLLSKLPRDFWARERFLSRGQSAGRKELFAAVRNACVCLFV